MWRKRRSLSLLSSFKKGNVKLNSSKQTLKIQRPCRVHPGPRTMGRGRGFLARHRVPMFPRHTGVTPVKDRKPGWVFGGHLNVTQDGGIHVRVPGSRVPAPCLSAAWEAGGDGPSGWVPAPTGETRPASQAAGFSPARPCMLQAVQTGGAADGGLCLSAFP